MLDQAALRHIVTIIQACSGFIQALLNFTALINSNTVTFILTVSRTIILTLRTHHNMMCSESQYNRIIV